MSETKQIIPGSGWNAAEWLSIVVIVIGTALLTLGITIWVKEGLQHGLLYLSGGALAVTLPFCIVVSRMNKGKVKYEYPSASNGKLTRGDRIQVILLTLVVALLIVGFGVALASVPLMIKYGWGFAEHFLWYGLLGAGVPMILFILFSSIFVK